MSDFIAKLIAVAVQIFTDLLPVGNAWAVVFLTWTGALLFGFLFVRAFILFHIVNGKYEDLMTHLWKKSWLGIPQLLSIGVGVAYVLSFAWLMSVLAYMTVSLAFGISYNHWITTAWVIIIGFGDIIWHLTHTEKYPKWWTKMQARKLNKAIEARMNAMPWMVYVIAEDDVNLREFSAEESAYLKTLAAGAEIKLKFYPEPAVARFYRVLVEGVGSCWVDISYLRKV